MGKKRYVVELSGEEREILERATRKTSGSKALHAWILLKAGEGWIDERIADAYDVSVSTVERVRRQFVEEGFEAALKRKPTSRVYRRKIEGEEEAHLIALCCSDPPEGHARWSMQLLADKMVELKYVESVSDETIRRAMKKTSSSLGSRKSGVSLQSKTLPLSAKWKRL